jgi:hypothetical protein
MDTGLGTDARVVGQFRAETVRPIEAQAAAVGIHRTAARPVTRFRVGTAHRIRDRLAQAFRLERATRGSN